MKHTLTIVAVALALSCANDPIQPKPIPGNPCGYLWSSCGNHFCCPDDSDCGGPVPSCPVGLCCYHGSTTVYGSRMVKQRPEQSQ